MTADTFGQRDSSDIYYKALEYYLLHLDSIDSKTNELFIEEAVGMTTGFPKQIRQRTITIITWDNKKEIYRSHNDKIQHIVISPATLVDNKILIQFNPLFGQYRGKKKGYFLEISDWVIIKFQYDCNDKSFKYFATETGGI